jgi:hypothetical protein
MFKNTDVLSLGTIYTVADKNGKLIKNVQVIPYYEILNAAIGEYSETEHGTIAQYLEKSIEVLSGFDNIDPNRVMWFSSMDENVKLSELLEKAISNGYEKIIMEHIEFNDSEST